MEFEYLYKKSSSVTASANEASMSFSPDTRRDPTYFIGKLRQGIAFREAISALHDVVISDLRFVPKNREAYKAWRAMQDEHDVTELAASIQNTAAQIQGLRAELNEIWDEARRLRASFEQAQQSYFNHIYKRDYAAWLVLDPVITVHPDEVFFECFSKDESSYGRLGASYDVFEHISELACGTTNIDYSEALYTEFQKIRSYKATSLTIDPSGFEVKTAHEDDFKEVKIDLPDSWVRGFLQVNSAMTLPSVRFDLHPMDLHNLCFVMRRKREKHGPRALRYILTPGQPVRAVFEPWEHEVVCTRSIYKGDKPQEIRVWGRRRLHMLERLIPIARKFTVHLLGQGLPSFYIADLGPMSFTLGLSGWTANDWAQAGNFDLMAPRASVDAVTQRVVFNALKQGWLDTPEALAQKLGLDRAVVLGALSAWAQAGRVMFDLHKNVYRTRELTRDPLPMGKLRFANEREEAAERFVAQRQVKVKHAQRDSDGMLQLTGRVSRDGYIWEPALVIDRDERIQSANCTCSFFVQNRLYQGPCEHMLATRMQHQQRTQ